jgi:hypothetical protein
MPFQFLCPQGHLLQGDEAHMGMQTQCPHCGIMFLIPVVGGTQPEVQGNQWGPASQETHGGISPEIFAGGESSGDFLERIAGPREEQVTDAAAGDASNEPASEFAVGVAEEPTPGVVHIPCPNGHELETPLDMLGQEVLCPHCHAQFHLRYEESREYQEKLAKRERELAKTWFNWAIAAAVLIGGGLLIMVAMSLSR